MPHQLWELFLAETEDYGIILLDTGGRILRWTHGAQHLFGYTAEEAEGRPASLIFIEPDRRAGVPEVELATARERGRAEDERWHVRKDGSRFWGSGVVIPLHQDGVLRGYAKVLRDFTERRRLEEAVRQAQKLESIGVLAAGIAHDFNNVLTAIVGNLSLLRTELPPEAVERVRPLLHDAENASRRAADLVRQLLSYAGKGRRDVRAVDLCEAAAEAVAIVRAAVSRRITLRLEHAAACPPIHGDPVELQQLLLNLVLNAAEAIGDRAGEVVVETRSREVPAAELHARYPGFTLAPRPYLEIRVHDTGTGMDRETLERIFDPFFTTKFMGRGLGLAAALGITRSHGGGISVTSVPGRGTTFTVLLPADPELREAGGATETASAAVRGSGTVILFEDDASVRGVVRRSLEGLGYRVIAAGDAEEGFALLQRAGGEIALVILDLDLPGPSVTDTAAALREGWPGVPVVVITGIGAEEARTRLRGIAVAGLLPKPFSPEQLARAVASARRFRVPHD